MDGRDGEPSVRRAMKSVTLKDPEEKAELSEQVANTTISAEPASASHVAPEMISKLLALLESTACWYEHH